MKINIKKIIIIVLILIIALFIFLFIRHNKNSLEELIVNKDYEWNIFRTQNTILDGDLMGFAYEKDYNVNNIPKKYLYAMIVDYYIVNDSTFYSLDNLKKDNFIYEKKVSQKEIDETIRNMFGPDFKINMEDYSYGCGRSITKEGSDYIITAYDTEYCGVFSYDEEYYHSSIYNFYQDGDEIIIELKVGYIDTDYVGDEEDYFEYNVYSDKTKQNIIESNFNDYCFV